MAGVTMMIATAIDCHCGDYDDCDDEGVTSMMIFSTMTAMMMVMTRAPLLLMIHRWFID